MGAWLQAPSAPGRACQHRAHACISLQEAGAQAMPEGCQARGQARRRFGPASSCGANAGRTQHQLCRAVQRPGAMAVCEQEGQVGTRVPVTREAPPPKAETSGPHRATSVWLLQGRGIPTPRFFKKRFQVSHTNKTLPKEGRSGEQPSIKHPQLRAGGEGGDRERDGWMASLTQ